MRTSHSWCYFRNISILKLTGIGCVLALRAAFVTPSNLLWGAPLFYLAYLIWGAFSFAYPPRRLRYWAPQEFLSPAHEKVLFKSRDGLTLYGRYLPGKSRAAVILVHGIGGSGLSMEVSALPRVRAGYNALLIDLRAHGSGVGDTSTYGVLEPNDVAGAVDYLLSRGDIVPDKIGVLGISLGAQAGLRAGLQCETIRALVLEELGPADIRDRVQPASEQERRRKLLMLWHKLVYARLVFEQWVINSFSGQRPTSLSTEIGKLAPRPVLLIPCGKFEILFNRRFCDEARESCTFWELPKAQHGSAHAYEPQEYPKRIVAFFNHALGENRKHETV